MNMVLTRRHMLAASAAAVTSEVLVGCAAEAETVLSVNSILFIPFVVNVAASVFTTHYVEPELVKPTEVSKAASSTAGANVDMCMAAAKVVGGDFVVKALKTDRPVWCSYNRNLGYVNSFSIKITNNGDDPLGDGGQLRFLLKDESTGAPEKDFWSDGFLIPPNQSKILTFGPYKGPFSEGKKTLIVTNAPQRMTVSDVSITVIPMTMQA